MSNVIKKKDAPAAQPFVPREVVTDEERALASAAKEIAEVVKRFRLSEGAMWAALGTAGTYCVTERVVTCRNY